MASKDKGAYTGRATADAKSNKTLEKDQRRHPLPEGEDASDYWSGATHHDGRPADIRAGKSAETRVHGWDEDADRRYLEEEQGLRARRDRPVFDAADEMDNPGLMDDRDVMSGRDRGIPTHEDVQYSRTRDKGTSGRDTRQGR